MKKIKLEMKNRLVNVANPFGEKSRDYMSDNIFIFETGKIYGIVCEHGGGGEAVSLLLSNQIPWKEEKIYFDDVVVGSAEVQKVGWYLGRPIYSNLPTRREVSIKKALKYACNKIVYCFPWMNTLEFYDCLYNSSVFRFFKKLKNEGAIIILPTSRKENVIGFADEIIRIQSQRFEHIISDSQYFKDYF